LRFGDPKIFEFPYGSVVRPLWVSCSSPFAPLGHLFQKLAARRSARKRIFARPSGKTTREQASSPQLTAHPFGAFRRDAEELDRVP
jgi:hypothetical protein